MENKKVSSHFYTTKSFIIHDHSPQLEDECFHSKIIQFATVVSCGWKEKAFLRSQSTKKREEISSDSNMNHITRHKSRQKREEKK